MQMTTTFDEARIGREVKVRLHDMAVMGDPLSGPAFGQFEKNKALGMIIGVVAAVVTMGAALPLLAAEVLATQIAGGIMFAGGALSGIGAVTGNKKLQKIGGVMSLAGGIGALASNAANAAGAGGAFASGSGSTAVQNMAGTMMESVNSVGGAVGFGDVYDATKAANAAGATGTDGVSSTSAVAEPGAIEVKPLADPAAPVDASTATQGAPVADVADSTLKLTDPAAASTPAEPSVWKPSDAAMGADPKVEGVIARNTDAGLKIPTGGGVQNPDVGGTGLKLGDAAGVKPPPKGILENSLSWAKDNAEIIKMGGSAVKEAVGWGFAPDQQAELSARAAAYGAQASFTKSQQELLDYQRANMASQVAMISANDPDMDAKLQRAAANKTPVVFIPAIGAGGIKQNGGAFNAASGNMAQQPARQATFGQQPAAA